jgi:putative membrane protein
MQRSIKDYFTITLKGNGHGCCRCCTRRIWWDHCLYNRDLPGTHCYYKRGELSLFWVPGKQKVLKLPGKSLNGPFILALLTGILISIFTVMRIANYLLEEHPVHIWSFFFGLIVASVWFVAKQVPKWNFKIGLALIALVQVLHSILSPSLLIGRWGSEQLVSFLWQERLPYAL